MSKAWMPMYWGDYLRDTQHLTTLQHGAYILLMAHYWNHGALPKDVKLLQKISGLTSHLWTSNCQAIASLFGPDWSHKRIDEELHKASVISTKRAMAGYRGGRMSRGKNNFERQTFEAFAHQLPSKRAHITKISKKEEEGRSKIVTDGARSLATALPTGALARGLEAGAKRPSEMSRAEIDALITRKHS